MTRLLVASVAAGVVALGALTPAAAAERDFTVGGFDRLALSGSPEVVVVTGRQPGVRASGLTADLDRLMINVEGGALKIGTKPGGLFTWHSGGPIKIAVTVPMLRAVDVAGSGGVVVDRVKTHEFVAALSGSGSIRVASLETGSASFSSSGSGLIAAAGQCTQGSARIAGSGVIRIGALKCATLSASIAGSGTIDAFATQTASLSTMGSGDINLSGGARCTVSSAGSGRSRCS